MGNSIKNRRRIAEYAEPRGLYAQCAWDKRIVRKEILAGKLAPCFPGVEAGALELEECPICLLFYPGGLNRMTCCKQSMCTECLLQMKPPPPTISRAKCPFCKSERLDAIFTGPLSKEQRQIAERDQQRVLEAQIKMQAEERKRDAERAQQKLLKKDTETEESKKESKNSSPSPRSDSPPATLSTQARTSMSSLSSDPPELDADSGPAGGGESAGPILSDYYDGDDIEQLMLEEALRQSLLEAKSFHSQPPSVSTTNSSSPSPSSAPNSSDTKLSQNPGSTSSTSLSTSSISSVSSETESMSSVNLMPVHSAASEIGDLGIHDDEDDDEETRQAIALSLASAPASS